MQGNLAPSGAVAKLTGKEGLSCTASSPFSASVHYCILVEGMAIVFDSEEAMIEALERSEIRPGHVVIIRYEGPIGGPGMPEMRM